jgi:hypothetical protein
MTLPAEPTHNPGFTLIEAIAPLPGVASGGGAAVETGFKKARLGWPHSPQGELGTGALLYTAQESKTGQPPGGPDELAG